MTAIPTPAIQSALRVLDTLSACSRGLTLSELHVRLAIPKSSLSRMLHTLEDAGLLSLQSGGYQIGAKVLDYAAAYTRQLDIIEVFQRVAEQIVSEIDETAQLARFQDGEMVFLAKRDCQRLIRPAAYPGRRVAVHASAVGKASLAHLGESEVLRLYPDEHLPALTAHTITSRSALLRELAQIRERGYATTMQESTLNLCCFSSPVWDMTGRVVAALSICLATDRPDAARYQNASRAVVTQAAAISRALGGKVPQVPPPAAELALV